MAQAETFAEDCQCQSNLTPQGHTLPGFMVTLATMPNGWAEAAAEGAAREGTEAGLSADVSSPPCGPEKMPRAVCWWLYFGLGILLAGQAEAPSPVEPPERSRPYAVLRGQNLGERPPAGWLRTEPMWEGGVRRCGGPEPAWLRARPRTR